MASLCIATDETDSAGGDWDTIRLARASRQNGFMRTRARGKLGRLKGSSWALGPRHGSACVVYCEIWGDGGDGSRDGGTPAEGRRGCSGSQCPSLYVETQAGADATRRRNLRRRPGAAATSGLGGFVGRSARNQPLRVAANDLAATPQSAARSLDHGRSRTAARPPPFYGRLIHRLALHISCPANLERLQSLMPCPMAPATTQIMAPPSNRSPASPASTPAIASLSPT